MSLGRPEMRLEPENEPGNVTGKEPGNETGKA